ncbi:hypothetical protein JOB18_014194, partial [Solea senegalensis]
MVDINIHDGSLMFKIDTGANVTVLPHAVFLEIYKNNPPMLRKPTKPLLGPGRSPLDVVGVARLPQRRELGVICRVEEPTDWCAGMVVVPKKTGSVHICVDLTKLNESVCREKFKFPEKAREFYELHWGELMMLEHRPSMR